MNIKQKRIYYTGANHSKSYSLEWSHQGVVPKNENGELGPKNTGKHINFSFVLCLLFLSKSFGESATINLGNSEARSETKRNNYVSK